jgi:acyl-CoA reductase-like NAD-dependent aldehyde dehydrogenase
MDRRVGKGNIAAILPYNAPAMTFALAFAGAYIFEENCFEIKPATFSKPFFHDLNTILDSLDMGSLLINFDGSERISQMSGKRFLEKHLRLDSGTSVIEVFGHDSLITPEIEQMLRDNPNVTYILEGPGKNRFVVTDPTSNLDKCVDVMLQMRLLNNGQACMASELFDIHENVYPSLLPKLLSKAKEYKVGDPNDKDTDIGPLLENIAIRIENQINDAIADGAKIEFMSKTAITSKGNMDFYNESSEQFHIIPYEKAEGLFYVPLTILSGTNSQMKIRINESFGPVIPLSIFRELDELRSQIYSARYGMNMAIFGDNINREFVDFAKVHVGYVFENEFMLAPGQLNLLLDPWGGQKYSRFSLQGLQIDGKPSLVKKQTGPGYIILDFSKAGE